VALCLGRAYRHDDMTVLDVYGALWRRKLLIVLATAALLGATVVLTSRQQPEYEATSLVRVQQSVTSPTEAFVALQTGERLARTYAKIATTRAVASAIEGELAPEVRLGEIAEKISATQVDDLDLLAISARGPDPLRAQLIANAAPSALRHVIRQTGTLRDNITVIQRAGLPVSPVSPNLKLNLALALLCGLIFNAGLALLLDALGDRVSDPDELERMTGIPVLATVPTLRLVRATSFDRTLLDANGTGSVTERFGKAART